MQEGVVEDMENGFHLDEPPEYSKPVSDRGYTDIPLPPGGREKNNRQPIQREKQIRLH
jgi:hypothetical protein